MKGYENPLIHHEVKTSGNYVENRCTCTCRAHRQYFPPGYRFVPKDEELIIEYLQRKINNEPIPVDEMSDVNLYEDNPQDLAEKNPQLGEDEWYFFTPRDRKYPNGFRPNRAAGTGYWKATGADKSITSRKAIGPDGKPITIGYRKVLVFYEGKPPKGDKTDWIMHEFRGNQPPRDKTDAKDMRLDDWVLCRIYKKAAKSNKNQEEDDAEDKSTNPVDHHDHGIHPSSNNLVDHLHETINPLDQGLMGVGEHSLAEAVEPKENPSAADNNNIDTAIHEHPNNVGLISNYGDFNQVVYCHPIDYDTTWSTNFGHWIGYGYGAVNPYDQSPFNSAEFLLNENYLHQWTYDQALTDLDSWGVEIYHHQGFQQEHSPNVGPSSIGNTTSDTTDDSTEIEDDLKTRNLKIADSCNGGLEEKKPYVEQFDGQWRQGKKRRQ